MLAVGFVSNIRKLYFTSTLTRNIVAWAEARTNSDKPGMWFLANLLSCSTCFTYWVAGFAVIVFIFIPAHYPDPLFVDIVVALTVALMLAAHVNEYQKDPKLAAAAEFKRTGKDPVDWDYDTDNHNNMEVDTPAVLEISAYDRQKLNDAVNQTFFPSPTLDDTLSVNEKLYPYSIYHEDLVKESTTPDESASSNGTPGRPDTAAGHDATTTRSFEDNF